MINIPNIDLKIWNPEEKTIEIIHSLQTTGIAQISMNGEGGDCKTLGLYHLLDMICDTFQIDSNRITIHTNNQLETHPGYTIKKSEPLYIKSGQQFAREYNVPEKNWDSLKHFGIFVGRSSWQRLWIASHIWHKYKNITEITYHYTPGDEYHRLHLGLDELMYHLKNQETVKPIYDFLEQLPIKNDTIDSYPIITPAHFSISKLYPNFFVEVVCETYLSGNTFYPTEKTWRPFICRTPFIMIGPKNFLYNLRKLGFKTFSNWWDESYDQDADLDNGMVMIKSVINILDYLSSLSREELEGMMIDMQDTLEHNYQRFMSLSDKDFQQLWPLSQ
jgi:hypothetical protein